MKVLLRNYFFGAFSTVVLSFRRFNCLVVPGPGKEQKETAIRSSCHLNRAGLPCTKYVCVCARVCTCVATCRSAIASARVIYLEESLFNASNRFDLDVIDLFDASPPVAMTTKATRTEFSQHKSKS